MIVGGVQAAWRGVLARRAAQERRRDIAAAKIAASWRMYQFRKAFVQRRRYAPSYNCQPELPAPVDMSPQSWPSAGDGSTLLSYWHKDRGVVHFLLEKAVRLPAYRVKILITGWAQTQDKQHHTYYSYMGRGVGPRLGPAAVSVL